MNCFFVPRQSLKWNSSVVQCMNILGVQLYDGSVIFNSILVVLELCQAVCSVVESLNAWAQALVSLLWTLDFQSVVLDSLLVILKFSINQSSIRIDYWVFVVNKNCSIKVKQRVLQITHVPVAAASVVQVNWVLWIDLDCSREVFNCFLELLESVPD